PYLGQFHEHDVTERILGIVRDADRAIGSDPLMFFRIFAVGGVRHVGFWLLALSSWLFLTEASCPWWLSFFRTLIKRCWYYLRFHALAAYFDSYRRSKRSMLGRNIGERNILLQERRGRTARNVADLAAALVQNFVPIASDASINHFEPAQRFLHSFRFRLFECRAPDKLRLLHLAETIQSRFPHIDRVRDFVSVEGKLAFQPQRIARTQTAGDRAKLFSGR